MGEGRVSTPDSLISCVSTHRTARRDAYCACGSSRQLLVSATVLDYGEQTIVAERRRSFVAGLKAQRERQQVTLDAIADATKIRRPLLEGLERNDVAQWPCGIFRRSYFRAYAVAIGLDPEPAVRDFLSLYPDPIEASALLKLRRRLEARGIEWPEA